jgi:hypothetical protein
MSDLPKLLREKIESTISKCEEFEDMLLLYATGNDVQMFSINKIVYVCEDNCIFRLDNMLTEDCVLDRKVINNHLQNYIDDYFIRLKTADVLKYALSNQ